MQEKKHSARSSWQKALFVLRNTIALLLLIIGSTALFASSALKKASSHGSPGRPAAPQTVAFNGASRWVGDTQATAPTFDFSPAGASELRISPLFSGYYSSHSGGASLGSPVTVAFPIEQGWIQFFSSGALLLPAAQQKHTLDASDVLPEDALAELIERGARDPNSGIVRLPLLQALLTAGSQAPVGGDGSTLTYADLRDATSPEHMLAAPSGYSSVEGQTIFIQGGVRAGKAIGHLVPQVFWSYINRADISPDGWETVFGPPLTEALAFTIASNGSTRRVLVQVFWRDALILDQSASQPQIRRLATGVDYLRTLGPPTPVINAQQPGWAQFDTALLDAPGTGQAVAHVGLHFPLTLLGDASWSSGTLWYHAQWTTPKGMGDGWVEASAITFTSPGNVPAWASLDVLSSDLGAYLASIGGNVGVMVYDVTRQRYYTYNADSQFITGSSVKVPIMLTLLDMTESEGREPDDNEMSLLTTMIENSNNDSAAALYYGEINGAAGLAAYMQKIGIGGLDPDPDAFGWSVISPTAMVNILTDLYEGRILTAQDRSLALSLMENIETDQQVGVGDTAPAGATVAMKDGWVPGPDGLWTMNSSGIVTLGQETYIIAVYTQGQNSLQDGQAIAEHVCSAVASLLT